MRPDNRLSRPEPRRRAEGRHPAPPLRGRSEWEQACPARRAAGRGQKPRAQEGERRRPHCGPGGPWHPMRPEPGTDCRPGRRDGCGASAAQFGPGPAAYRTGAGIPPEAAEGTALRAASWRPRRLTNREEHHHTPQAGGVQTEHQERNQGNSPGDGAGAKLTRGGWWG